MDIHTRADGQHTHVLSLNLSLLQESAIDPRRLIEPFGRPFSRLKNGQKAGIENDDNRDDTEMTVVY